jgi:opacity protein-like surface antigen
MFDGILKNMLTDLIRGILFAVAGSLGLTGTTNQQFIAGGLAVFAGVWAWYENVGHQKIANMLKYHADNPNATLVARARTLPETKQLMANMTHLLLAAFIALGMATPAFAQVAKAPVVVACPPMCSGWTIGGGVGGVGSNLDILGGGLSNSVFAGGGVPYIELGYQFDNGMYFFRGDVRFGDQFATKATTTLGTASENGILGEECVSVGLSLGSLLNNGATQIPIPASFAAMLVSPYFGACGVERSFANGWATIAGAEFALTTNWLLKAEYQYINYGAATNGIAAINSENLGLLGLSYRFPPGTLLGLRW